MTFICNIIKKNIAPNAKYKKDFLTINKESLNRDRDGCPPVTSPDGMDDATGCTNVGFKAATSATNWSNTNGSVKQTCLVERLQQIRIPI